MPASLEKVKVAVVTGGNKGIGFGIVRALCKEFDGHVYLTARDEERGNAAVKLLNKEGLEPRFHQLDIEDPDSVLTLANFIRNNYEGLDVLVNNAGIAFKSKSNTPFSEQADVTTKCNFYGTLDVCRVMFPLLRPHARVCNVSSMMSQIALAKCSPAVKDRFLDPKRTMDELEDLITQFVELAQEGQHEKAGFTSAAYGISKLGVTVMTRIQQKELDKDKSNVDIVVNACCPGFVDTDMTSHIGNLTIDQGAETPVYCALLPPNIDSPRGEFIREKSVLTLEKDMSKVLYTSLVKFPLSSLLSVCHILIYFFTFYIKMLLNVVMARIRNRN